MGKKSLFQSTSQSKKNDHKKDESATAPEENPEMTPPAAPEPAPPTEPAPAATDTGTTAEPASAAPSEPPRPKQASTSPERPAPAPFPRENTRGSMPGGQKTAPAAGSFDDSGQVPPLDGFLKTVVAVVGGLLLLLFLASLFHADNYYVRQADGAVEIWKGTFTPAGKERLLILHGADWDRPEQDVYDKKTVYTFAAGAYAAKAMALAGESGLPDYDRIDIYLERSLELFAEIDNQQAVDTIRQVQTYLDEAAILDASGEKEAMALAGRRLDTVQHALSGIVMSTRPQEKKSAAPAQEGKAPPEAPGHK